MIDALTPASGCLKAPIAKRRADSGVSLELVAEGGRVQPLHLAAGVVDDDDFVGSEHALGDRERAITSSVTMPPALRSTLASPSSQPSAASALTRGSMQVTTATRFAGRPSPPDGAAAASLASSAGHGYRSTEDGSKPGGTHGSVGEGLACSHSGSAGSWASIRLPRTNCLIARPTRRREARWSPGTPGKKCGDGSARPPGTPETRRVSRATGDALPCEVIRSGHT